MKFYCKCPSLFICITKDDPPPGRCRRLRPHASQCHPLLGGGWSSGDAASAEPSPPPPYPPSTMHSPMTCAHPAPSSSSPLMAQPAVFVGVLSHHLGSTSPRRLRRLLRFSPRPPPSCVLVSSVVAPDPDDDDAADVAAADDDADDDDTVSEASTAMTDAACGSSPP